jgi:hypothetical protein
MEQTFWYEEFNKRFDTELDCEAAVKFLETIPSFQMVELIVSRLMIDRSRKLIPTAEVEEALNLAHCAILACNAIARKTSDPYILRRYENLYARALCAETIAIYHQTDSHRIELLKASLVDLHNYISGRIPSLAEIEQLQQTLRMLAMSSEINNNQLQFTQLTQEWGRIRDLLQIYVWLYDDLDPSYLKSLQSELPAVSYINTLLNFSISGSDMTPTGSGC